MKQLTSSQKEDLKRKAITELFKSKALDEKINGVLFRHHIPTHANIQDDVLQTVYLELMKYSTDKFVEAYTDNPKRILALAVRIMINKGVYYDKRSKSGHKASIAQDIIHQSSLTNYSISTTADYEDEKNTEIKNAIAVNDEPFVDDDSIEMWEYVKQALTVEENALLSVALNNDIKKLKKKLKQQIEALYPKLQELITYKKLKD